MNETTRISIEATSEYIAEQSNPAEERYVFAYRIRIANEGNVAARLVSRHWVITDASGEVQEVRGQGVVGEQPLLEPGHAFEYTSGCAIATPVGTMRGSYQMEDGAGGSFEAEIPEFMLSGPRVLH